MLIEVSRCLGLPVAGDNDQKLGEVDLFVFDSANVKIAGIQVVQNSVIKKFSGLFFDDITEITPAFFRAKTDSLQKNLKELDAIAQTAGKVLGVAATSESGQALGAVTDVLFEAETGIIVRFTLRHFLRERIIPRQFLVSITPKKIVFQDVVSTPVFDKVATMPAPEVA